MRGKEGKKQTGSTPNASQSSPKEARASQIKGSRCRTTEQSPESHQRARTSTREPAREDQRARDQEKHPEIVLGEVSRVYDGRSGEEGRGGARASCWRRKNRDVTRMISCPEGAV